MAVAVTVDIPGGNQQVYEQLTAKLFPAVQQADNVTPQLTFFPVHRLIRA